MIWYLLQDLKYWYFFVVNDNDDFAELCDDCGEKAKRWIFYLCVVFVYETRGGNDLWLDLSQKLVLLLAAAKVSLLIRMYKNVFLLPLPN